MPDQTAPPNWRPFLRTLLLGVALGIALGAAGAWYRLRPAPPNPQEHALDANYWVQTSAEYRACCLQAYRLAADRLKAKLPAGPGMPPAVVFDLDETMFDNSPFQAYLYRHGVDYSDALWEEWEQNHPDEVRLIPGAKDFIEEAERSGVTVFYVSNRLEKYRASTVAALTRLGLEVKGLDQRLLLKTDTSDKTIRRWRVEANHRVLLYLGDNLRDFSEEFVAPNIDREDGAARDQALAERNKKVDARGKRWGDDWIILPNPTYGEWQRLIGSRPADNLRSTSMPPPQVR